GLARAAQGGQDVELPRIQLRPGEGAAAHQVEVTREAGHPGQHLERRHVEVWAFAAPGRDDAVDLVRRGPPGHAIRHASGPSPRSTGRRCMPDSPFQARLTRWAATSAFFGLRASSQYWPVSATMPTSICA